MYPSNVENLNIAYVTIVWYGHDGVPVSIGSKLGLTADRGPVLSDPQGKELWNSQLILNNDVAHGFMNDTGNFVLEGGLDTLVENDMEALNEWKTLERFLMVTIWCIQEDPSLRPTMRKVTQMLDGVVEFDVPQCPSQVSFTS
ncbi:G-type lectin S-receptor-like serine/threonine-protein kinase LECRK1 [Camellia lanceoleosa]|uniref:G-type lectin S-receptor-like serine/threonine-protein kinase LECRK1 n=1 Tax=Camellia lanceoleosa TaxID=1840588 RepID=A0ACC0F7U1_9ERIC|nr:G-type lectin S-receptor-like serine/threonine-protein kinase LECRK1 [Camellia lanceoleosa]